MSQLVEYTFNILLAALHTWTHMTINLYDGRNLDADPVWEVGGGSWEQRAGTTEKNSDEQWW